MERSILIFSHNYLVNDWITIVSEQFGLLKRTGLYQKAKMIHLGVFPEDHDDFSKFITMVEEFDIDCKTIVHYEAKNESEKSTLITLQDVCQKNPNADVLYYHTKGVTTNRFKDPKKHRNVTSWRHAMEYFCIENWPMCINALQEYDCVGILHTESKNENSTLSYFSGNFWWSKSEHIFKTPSMYKRGEWTGFDSLVTSIPHTFLDLYHPSFEPGDSYFSPEEYRNFNCFLDTQSRQNNP